MKNYTFLLPLYNDWQSLERLLKDISSQMKKIKEKANILVVDDFSNNSNKMNISNLQFIKKIEILRLNQNLGSQKAILIGLRYLQKLKQKSIITILDSDGEDDVNKIVEMTNYAKINSNKIVVACRTKRREGFIFSLFYNFHKMITFLFTLKWINFGNYSSFHSKNLDKILSQDDSWFAYSSAISKNSNLFKLFFERKKRYSGKSKLSFADLFLHSLRINCVFFYRIFYLSAIYIFILLSFEVFLPFLLFPLIVIIIFNIAILFTFFTVKPSKYSNKLKFIDKKIILKK